MVVPKPSNDLRICVDMREANTAVLRERFPLPNIDQTLEEMNGAKIFTKLDLTQGYRQIPQETSSRDITNFVTYDGIYRYCRLNFGISCAPEIYQRIIQQTIQDIKGCNNISDGPRQANLVLITYASSEGSGEPAHPRSLARTSAARSYKQ